MKYKTVILLLSIWVCSFAANAQNSSDTVRIFSRYNYYITGQDAQILCVLPDNVTTAGYSLLFYQQGHQLKAQYQQGIHKITATINAAMLKEGTTPLYYRLLQGKKVSANGVVNLIVRPAKTNAVQIDELTGGLLVSGNPFLPFGFYCGPVGNLPQQEVVHGFNMIGPYQDNLPASYATRKAYMDRCAQLGIKVQYGVNSLIGSGHNGSKGLDKTDEEKLALLKSEVIAFRDHPALLSWYINDEPDGQGRPPKILEDAYKVIHELDPYHPISIVFMMPQKANDFRNTMDIAMTDPYPIPGAADKVMDDIKKYVKAYRYEKSVWLVPQAFGGQEMWTREPTGQEIRLMTYMGLVSGAKGIQYYVHAPGNLNPQSVSAWSACSDVAVETAQMTSFLLSADDAPEFTAADPKLLTHAYNYKGNLLVIVVNNENKPKSFSINTTARDTSLNNIAELWFENRNVPYTNGQVSDIIDAYGTRVYLIRRHQPNSPLISANNLTINPSFEKIVSPGLPVGSNVNVNGNKKADEGATFFADPTQSVDGMFSLRLVTPVDSGGKKIRLLPMVFNKGNSYTVSIWAKAKTQEKPAAFNLAIDAVKQTHTYPLTSNWKKYSFTFQSPVSTTTGLLTLDLVQQGTAWFDLIQVSPDPVINYSINTAHVATINVASNTGNGTLRYAIDGLPNEHSPVYKSPVQINRSATFYAGIFEGEKLIASSGLFIPVNKALGKPVKFVNAYDLHYTAAGDGSLTDGLMGTTAFKDGKWIGYAGVNMDIITDLQQSTLVKSVTGSFLCDPNSGIFLPSIMEVFTSTDGVNFIREGEVANTAGSVRGEPYLQKYTVPVNDKQVRYIRITAKTIGTIPDGYLFKGSTSWLFTDELLVQ